jgi:RNA polymerase sigma-70 factor, ECF subfamily
MGHQETGRGNRKPARRIQQENGSHFTSLEPDQADAEERGLFESRRIAFIESIAALRPRMHRYCARMTGSALDGEDVMQEAICDAYLKLGSFDATRPLGPWLLRIAHNRCIDFLRRRQARREAEAEAVAPALIHPPEAVGRAVDRAIERMVIALPPKERACVLLKDVFDYSLEEIAGLVESTAGGVKAALNRGRGKLAKLTDVQRRPERKASQEELALLRLYVDRFNRRDWQGVRELASADARLKVADCFSGRLADSPYFVEYERPIIAWRMALGEADGETIIVILRDDPQGGVPFSAIRIGFAGDRVASITDYIKCSWILKTASVTLAQP